MAKSDGPLPADFTAVLLERLDAEGASWRWQIAPRAEVQAVPPPRINARLISAALPWLIAIAFLLVPSGLGVLLAPAARRLSRASSRSRLGPRAAAIPYVGLAVLPLPLGYLMPELSIYDIGLVCWLFALGIALRARQLDGKGPPPQGLLAAAFASAFGFIGLEVFARLQAAALPPLPAASEMRLSFSPAERERPCAAIYPDALPEPRFVRLPDATLHPAPAPGVHRVMHVGDSTTEGADVPLSDTFVARLGQLHPDEEHLNLGISNTGTDLHLMVLREWLPRLHPDEVYLHIFPGNDVSEMDQRYACCDDGPLLDGAAPGFPARCPSPEWRFSLKRLLGQGPLPYPVRVASTESRAVRLLAYQFERGVMFRLNGRTKNIDLLWGDFEGTLKAFHETTVRAGVPLTVVVLPVRMIFDGSDPSHAEGLRDVSHRVLDIARSAGIRTLDAGAYFEDLYRRDPTAPLFMRDSQNSHFDRLGHKLYAEWIADQAR
ncbi:MAG: SGNH/GDSL hydrolase family protein [Byssovorax sp.]